VAGKSTLSFALSEHEADWISAARGIAAIAVLLTHTYYVFASRFTQGVDTTLYIFGVGSEAAVYMFFFLSGFLITLSIANNVRRNGYFSPLQYAKARILRIYPPLIGAIALVFVVGGIIAHSGAPLPLPGREVYDAKLYDGWTALTLRNGFGIADGPLWSLFIECQIYIVVAGVAIMVWSRGWQRYLGIVTAICGYRLSQTNEHFSFYGTIWVIGAIACILKQNHRFRLPPTPPWLASTGDFSYSLYVIHFPLLLLGLSLAPKWLSEMQTFAYGVAVMFIILLFSRAFSEIFEGMTQRPRLLIPQSKPN
jgi:peptidoglycan/LPS O-acetylase OafA/YrhL